jgi:hypothetical protein
MTLLRVCRVTPSTFAPSVTDNPKGSRHAVLMLRPGCGWFFIGMVGYRACSSSQIVTTAR